MEAMHECMFISARTNLAVSVHSTVCERETSCARPSQPEPEPDKHHAVGWIWMLTMDGHPFYHGARRRMLFVPEAETDDEDDDERYDDDAREYAVAVTATVQRTSPYYYYTIARTPRYPAGTARQTVPDSQCVVKQRFSLVERRYCCVVDEKAARRKSGIAPCLIE